MKEWTKVSNGHKLVIRFNEKAALEEIDKQIKEIKDSGEGFNDIYCYTRVYDYEQAVTIEECIADLEEMKNEIRRIAEDDGSYVFLNVSLKKNGTFKKTCKHTFREQMFGTYWEDSYGWYTQVLRYEPENDTEGVILLDNIVVHY